MKVHITIKSQLNPTSASMDTNYKKNYVRGGFCFVGDSRQEETGKECSDSFDIIEFNGFLLLLPFIFVLSKRISIS